MRQKIYNSTADHTQKNLKIMNFNEAFVLYSNSCPNRLFHVAKTAPSMRDDGNGTALVFESLPRAADK